MNDKLSIAIGGIYEGKKDTSTGKLSQFNLPDYRGMFLRDLDFGKGVDKGRSLGKNQDDSVKTHQHKYGYYDVLPNREKEVK